ncbi:MAG: DUF2946 family protein [Myxococcota bacterium]|nr:DUF2946 family protein [Myxococcota bacterium]
MKTKTSHVRMLLLLLGMASAFAPAISLAHCLDHLDEQYAAVTGAERGEGIPAEQADPSSPCDLCDVLANGRSTVAGSFVQAVAPIGALEAIRPLTSWWLPRTAQFEPDSQRAPPLS